MGPYLLYPVPPQAGAYSTGDGALTVGLPARSRARIFFMTLGKSYGDFEVEGTPGRSGERKKDTPLPP